MSQNKYAGTQTEKNLLEAFAGESQARNKYTYFASKAKKEGYEQIAVAAMRAPPFRVSVDDSIISGSGRKPRPCFMNYPDLFCGIGGID